MRDCRFKKTGFRVTPVAIRKGSMAIDRVNMYVLCLIDNHFNQPGMLQGIGPAGKQKDFRLKESATAIINDNVTNDLHDFKFSSKYATNFVAICSSLQSTVPFSVVPRVIAFLCTVTNWRLSLCNSERVIFRDGRFTFGVREAGSDRITGPPVPCNAVASVMIADTIEVVVCSNVCNVSVGAFTT